MDWHKKVYNFYLEGFSELSPWARTLWMIILVKLFVMFFILRLFFFRDTLKNRFSTDEERGNHVIEELISY